MIFDSLCQGMSLKNTVSVRDMRAARGYYLYPRARRRLDGRSASHRRRQAPALEVDRARTRATAGLSYSGQPGDLGGDA